MFEWQWWSGGGEIFIVIFFLKYSSYELYNIQPHTCGCCVLFVPHAGVRIAPNYGNQGACQGPHWRGWEPFFPVGDKGNFFNRRQNEKGENQNFVLIMIQPFPPPIVKKKLKCNVANALWQINCDQCIAK